MTDLRASEVRESASACLKCGSGELRRVEVVYREGRAVAEFRGMAMGTSEVLPVRVRGVRMTALARELAPPRRPPSMVLPAVALSVIGLFAAVLFLTLFEEGSGGSWPGLVLLVVLAIPFGMLLRSRSKLANTVTPRDVDRANWLWRRCWFCRRCGSVSLVAPGHAIPLPHCRLASSLVAVARRMQWRRPAPGSGR
jgi:hypothetical protein